MATHRSTAFLGGAIAFGLLTVMSPPAIAESPSEERSEEQSLNDSEASLAAVPAPLAESDPPAIEPVETAATVSVTAAISLPEFDAQSLPSTVALPFPTPSYSTLPRASLSDLTLWAGFEADGEEAILAQDRSGAGAAEESPDAAPDLPESPLDSSDGTAVEAVPDDATEQDEEATSEEPAAEEQDEEASAEVSADADADTAEDPEAAAEAARQRRLSLFSEGDRLFETGRYTDAEETYRLAKGTFEGNSLEPIEPISDPAKLSPAGQVYWREYQAGLESGLDTRIDVPLQLLTEENPEFVPGHLSYAERLEAQEQPEAALAVLERAATLYPNDLALTQARIDALVAQEEWLQAAIAARQFALINPDDPAAEPLLLSADEYQDRFRRRMRSRITRNAIGNVLAGGVGFALTGNIFGPLSALQTSILLMRGESAVGERTAQRAASELELITDEQVVTYVDDLGQELAQLGGRDEFEYEFYVVAENELNAFALPGGKVFVNAGAILKTETTAELAGLLAHEISHALLSHGFQLMTGGNLMANVMRVVPYGGIATNLAVLSYSRDMERQADRLGTRILAASPYAADGMARLMETLNEEAPQGRFDWLSSHPDAPERIRRLNSLIEENGYNRYAYEGVEEHQRIQDRVRRILIQAGVLLELDENGEPIDPEIDSEAESEVEPAAEPEVEEEAEEPEESPDLEVDSDDSSEGPPSETTVPQ